MSVRSIRSSVSDNVLKGVFTTVRMEFAPNSLAVLGYGRIQTI